jgi:hypothetical protein
VNHHEISTLAEDGPGVVVAFGPHAVQRERVDIGRQLCLSQRARPTDKPVIRPQKRKKKKKKRNMFFFKPFDVKQKVPVVVAVVAVRVVTQHTDSTVAQNQHQQAHQCKHRRSCVANLLLLQKKRTKKSIFCAVGWGSVQATECVLLCVLLLHVSVTATQQIIFYVLFFFSSIDRFFSTHHEIGSV